MNETSSTARYVGVASGAFLLFVAWQAVFHIWGESMPQAPVISLAVEMSLVVLITGAALALARLRGETKDRDERSASAGRITDDACAHLVSLAAALRALEGRPEQGVDPITEELVRQAVIEGGEALDLMDEFEGRVSAGARVSARLSVHDIVSEVVHSVRDAAGARGVSIRVDLPPGLPSPRASRYRLIVLLTHLLWHAIDCAPDGGAIALVGRPDQANKHVVFSAACTAARPEVPSPSPRPGDGDLTAHSHRCRMLAEALGGGVHKETGPEGTTFSVSLPLGTAED
jgi:signal transduction histidine kinase